MVTMFLLCLLFMFFMLLTVSETMAYEQIIIPDAQLRVDVGTLLGSAGSFVPRQGQVEEVCDRLCSTQRIRV